ncbi:iron-containing alcohol dehydrogenase [Oceanobacillus timonensis]|uniref:iron-containing alcohol dehydrogenase n=1 Tax=Oceanobacillus timonensis TaxID=1926285 RepID=UPI0009BAF53F|nr:iron-containing alcohol dehydrogenase [Oceanobacillus timonensis]
MLHRFLTPTEIILGKDSIKEIEGIIERENFQSALILTDKGIVQAGILPSLTNLLEEKCTYTIFDEVEPNPTDRVVEKAFSLFLKVKPDVLIAVGGGSSMDTAKAVGILATNGGEIIDFKGIDKVKAPITPIVAVPTTAGTGSEVTTTTVINDTKQILKYSIGGQHVAARWALLDPALTLTLPPHITAATGVDALTHAIEAYTSKKSYGLTDTLAVQAIRLIGENLRTAVFEGNNIEARQKMLEASLIAGIAFNNAKLGLCHALCNPLGAQFGVAHGVANSILLPRVTKFNLPAQLKKYAIVAQLLGENTDNCSVNEAAEKVVTAIEKLIIDVQLPFTLGEVGVDQKAVTQMVDECIDNPLIDINPRKATRDELIQIYKDCFH